MTINYTTLLGLALPVTGTESGTWGDDVSLGITDYIDIAVAGTNNITNDLDITFSITNGSSSGSNIVASPNSTTAQYMQLLCTGARTAIRNINCPESSKMYVVNNSTSGGYSVVIRGYSAGPTYTTGVTVANGEKAIVFWSSVANDFVKITSSTTTTTATNLAGGSLGSVPYQSAASTTTFLSGNTTTTPQFYTSTGTGSAAQAPSLTGSTGTGNVVLATSPTITTPTFTTSATVPLVYGGTGTGSSLTLQSTSGVGATDSIVMKVGNAGAVTALSVATTGIVSFPTTGAILLPVGTTGQEPGSPVEGMIRYNSTTKQFEGYSEVSSTPGWYSVGGSSISNDTSSSTAYYPLFAHATSGTAQVIYTSNTQYTFKPSTGELTAPVHISSNGFMINGTTVSTSYTIASGNNAFSVGPITLNSGVTVTVSSGQRWVTI